ncbi:MAG: hypothetical protein U0992_23020 [Planctomycetaceae bacterium]
MSETTDSFLAEHAALTRRYFLGLGAAGAAAVAGLPATHAADARDPRLQNAIDTLEPWLTPADKFRDVSRGKPIPHTLDEEQRQKVGLTRETWRLEVVSDPDLPAKLKSELTVADGTALDFAGLLKLAEQHAVRFAKVMTCLNIGCPLGTGIWEGVPLREVLWLTQPRENLRAVFYHGFHNDDPAQLFREFAAGGRIPRKTRTICRRSFCATSSMANGHAGTRRAALSSQRRTGSSRSSGSKIVLSNLFHANDTYAEGNNDVDSPLKSFAATLNAPMKAEPDTPIPITGYAQVGISGVSKVQVWIQNAADATDHGRYYADAPWIDAEILPLPAKWGDDANAVIPPDTHGFDADGRPKTSPLRLSKVHWAIPHPGLACRRVHTALPDGRRQGAGTASAALRFQKSGHAAIENIFAVRVGGV